MKPTPMFAAMVTIALLFPFAAAGQEPALEELRLKFHEKEVELRTKQRLQEIEMLGRPGPTQVGEELQDIRRHLFELDVEQARLEARREALTKHIREAEAAMQGKESAPERIAQVPGQIGQVFEKIMKSLEPLEGNLEEQHIDGLHGHLEGMRDEIAGHLEEVIGALEAHHERAERVEEFRHWLVETEAELAEVTAQRMVLRPREAQLAERMEELRAMLRDHAKDEQKLEELKLKILPRELEQKSEEEAYDVTGVEQAEPNP